MRFETTLGKWLARAARNCLLGVAAILAASGMTNALAQSKPALVRDVDNAALQPVQLVAAYNGAGYETAWATNLDGSDFTVPAGKRLVVEYVSAQLNIASGKRGVYASLSSGVNDLVRVPLLFGEEDPTTAVYSGGAMVRAYFNAGSSVKARCAHDAATGYCDVSIVGYLVTLP